MKTESGEVSHTLATTDINDLPVLTTNGGGGAFGNIRDPLQEIILLPGTNYQNGLAVVVNGLPANSENIRIEGQDSTSNIWKIAQQNSQGGVDAIQEVTVQTSNFNAEYGQAAGGYFNYTMKSGTNTFHGSAYDYFVNEALNAGLPFTRRCAGRSQLAATTTSIFATACAATTTVSRSADRFGSPKCSTARTGHSSSSTSNNSARTTLRPAA